MSTPHIPRQPHPSGQQVPVSTPGQPQSSFEHDPQAAADAPLFDETLFGKTSAHLQEPALYEGIRFKRIIAYILDVMIIGALILLSLLLVVFTLGLAAPLVFVILPFLSVLYHTLLLGGSEHATIGMRIMGLKMVSWNGQGTDYIQAGISTIVFYVSMSMTGGLILLISLFNEKARLVQDLLCGTFIVKRPEIDRLSAHQDQAEL